MMTVKYFGIFSVVACFMTVDCLDNGLALTPPMGWMAWHRFRCTTDCELYPDECVSDKLFRSMADRMVSDGYLAAGYEYIIIDDCWSAKERDSNGNLQPDPERFPYGIKNLSDYIHSKGLKFGMYADYGTLTCEQYPGSIDHLEQDANTFAKWEIDYLKLDGCNSDWKTIDLGYIQMGKYLNATGRPIVYSCVWPAYQEPKGMQSNYTSVAETCNLWRNINDINENWKDVTRIMVWFQKNQDRIASFSGPGHWNDPDMLIIGNFALSFEQSKAQITIWAVMAAPLLMAADLRTIEPKFRDILQNKGIIAVNQDPLGIMGRLVLMKENVDIWTKPLQPKANGKQPYAIGLVNFREYGIPNRLEFTLKELNITNTKGFYVKNLFETSQKKFRVADDETISLRINPTGGVLLRVIPK